jgi:hypothetical protein
VVTGAAVLAGLEPAPGEVADAVGFAPVEQAVTATASPSARPDAVNTETFMITSSLGS